MDETWRDQAACKGRGKLFFPPTDQTTGRRKLGPSADELTARARARKICAGCPVLQRCEDHTVAVAVQLGQEVMVAGGGTWSGRSGRALRLWLQQERASNPQLPWRSYR
jgi:hypothetical protein